MLYDLFTTLILQRRMSSPSSSNSSSSSSSMSRTPSPRKYCSNNNSPNNNYYISSKDSFGSNIKGINGTLYTVNSNTVIVKNKTVFHDFSILKNRLRSPRGHANSPSHGMMIHQSTTQQLIRCCARNYSVFLWLLVSLPVVVWVTQWNTHYYNLGGGGGGSDHRHDDSNPFYSSKRQTSTKLIGVLNLPSSVLLPKEESSSSSSLTDQQQRKNEFLKMETVKKLSSNNTRSTSADKQQTMNRSTDTSTNPKQQSQQQQQQQQQRPSLSSSLNRSTSKTRDLSLFEPSFHPIVPSDLYTPNSKNPLQVIYIGVAATSTATGSSSKKRENHQQRGENDDDSTSNDSEDPDQNNILPMSNTDHKIQSLLFDGIERSKYTIPVAAFVYHFQKLATSVNETFQREYVEDYIYESSIHINTPLVILIDWSGLRRDCHVVRRTFLHLYNRFDNLIADPTMTTTSTTKTKPLFVFVDESPSTSLFTECYDSLSLSTSSTFLVKRSIVEGRYWNNTKQWTELGHLIVPSEIDNNNNKYSVRRLPLTLSESWVTQFHERVGTNVNKTTDLTNIVLGSDETRTTDITLLYSGDSSTYSRLRGNVKDIVQKLYYTMETPPEIVYLPIHPDDAESGDIIEQLLSTKLVILAQSDDWEGEDGTYNVFGSRLLQAMASGALVFCDDMIAKPNGIRSKTNLIYYDSPESLESLIRYYLRESDKRTTIARHGLAKALGRHRTWHAVEALLFGKALTRTDKYWMEGPEIPILKRLYTIENDNNNKNNNLNILLSNTTAQVDR